MSTVLSMIGWNSLADNTPTVPADSPALWTMLAWARRQYGQTSTADSAQVSTSAATTISENTDAPATGAQSAAALAQPSSLDDRLSAHDPQGPPDQTTGAVSGTVDVSNPNGHPLTFALTGAPGLGSVSLNASSGAFTYTPMQAARLAAGTTAGADFDSFTVTVSDGQAATAVPVSVAVLPAVISAPIATAVGANPMGVAVSSSKTYVANSAGNSVSVTDRSTGVVSTIANVVAAPMAVALSSDGSRAYVAGYNGVSVVNTATNQVITTLATNGGQSFGVAVFSPSGQPTVQRVYVTNTANSTVSVINVNTATGSYTVAATVPVGTLPAGVAVSPDGTKVYVAAWGTNGVSVINTATDTVSGSPIAVGANPFGVAISPDGAKLYVSNYTSNSVSVINTAGTASVTATVAVGANPFGIALSPDASLLYAANGPDTVSVINTKTNTVINTLTIDSTPENNWHSVASSPDGRQIYVSDQADNQLRILTVNRGNTAPIAGSPTIGTPDATTGALTGALNFTDTDGDALSYSVPTQPTAGTVTVNNTAGTYTFTPTRAARDTAANGGPSATNFTITATDGLATTPLTLTNIPITPTPQGNRAPLAGTPTVGTPERVTGTVTGALNFTDPDNNSLTYTVPTQPSSGAMTVNPNGTYSFTPTQAARDTALQTPGPDSVTITVTASDGQASTPESVTVPIAPANVAPSAGTPTVGTPDPVTGAVRGSLNFSDQNGDPLTFSVPNQPSTGTVTLTGSTYMFTPTKTARDAAAAGGATSTGITVSASDGLASTSVTWSVPIAPTPPPNSPPTANPSQGVPDQSSGAITVTLNATDPDANPLTYTVMTAPTRGVLTSTASGQYTYTPTQLARFQANQTGAADFDQFTVSVSDGQAATPVTATVAILPQLIPSIGTTAFTGYNPMGVAVFATKAYVVNQASNTVSVIDRTNPTATPASISTTVSSPVAIALGPQGSNRAYVAGNYGLSVINTTTNQVVGTVSLPGGQSYGVAVSPNGQRVYVTMSGTGQLAVVNANTTNDTYTFGPTVNVGSTPSAIALNADGSRAYVANYSSNTVSILNTSTATPAILSTVAVGANPFGIVATADGSRVYVANSGGNTVSLINTTTPTPTVSSISVGPNPFGLAMSPDQSLIYAANANDTVSMIDIKTNTVYSTLIIDSQPENNWHWVAVAPDSRQIYITDLSDHAVRLANVIRGDTPPTAGSYTVGSPDATTGAVSGALKFTDTDGDTLSYSISGQPTSSTVTVSPLGALAITAAGGYTFTPTHAARDAAAQTPQSDTATFSVTANDGHGGITQQQVTVPIASDVTLSATTTAIPVGSNPVDVVVGGNNVYVANFGSNTVSVINPATRSVIKTLSVASPYTLAASADGKHVYVADNTSGVTGIDTVSVIDTTSNIVSAAIAIPDADSHNYGSDLVVSPDGSRLYVVNRYDETMSVISTATNTVVSTANIGYAPGGYVAVTPDGTRLYASTDDYGGVRVIATPTQTVTGAVDSLSPYGAYGLAISPDGKRAYVAAIWSNDGGNSSELQVIDTDPNSPTYNTVTAVISDPNGNTPYEQGWVDVALSPDGTRAYVTNLDGNSVAVINTSTNAIIGTFTTDQLSTGSDNRAIAVGPDGTVYIVDPSDGVLYASTVQVSLSSM
jgi:YVTN family beta-propeller protein